MKKTFQFLLLGFAFLSTLAAFSEDVLAQDPWPAFRQNNFHTGYTNFTGPLAPDLAWQYNTAGYTYSSPVVTSNRVYVASENELIALTHDGDEAWVYTFPGEVNSPAVTISGLVSTPAVAPDGSIYIGSLDNNVYAINNDGTLKWTFDTGDQVFSSPAIGPDGTVYIGSRSGDLFALNPDSGTAIWVAATLGEILSSPAIDPDGNIFVGSTGNRLYGFNGADGTVLWAPFVTEGEIVSSPAIGNGNVYFGSIDNNVYAVNRTSGMAAWNAPFSTGAEIISSPAIGPDGTVYIGSFDRRFYAINGTTGTAKWESPLVTDSFIAGSPAIDGFGNIYITSLDGSMYVLSDATSSYQNLWSFPTGSPIWSSPAIGLNGSVYIAATGSESEAGRLFAIHQAIYSLTFATNLFAGEDAPFSVSITGAPVAASGTLFYRSAGETTYKSLPFSGNAIIPGIDVDPTGFQYYIQGAEGTFPAELPAQKPATKPVSILLDSSPDFLLPRIHRMISVPYNLTENTIAQVLGDDYEAPGPQSWLLHRWNGTSYDQYPELSEFIEPGKAFFLVTTHGDPFDVGQGRSVDTAQPYPITLKPGWNQVGNPFGFPVSWSSVIRNPEVVGNPVFFNGAEMIQDDLASSLILDPWEGYFVYNSSDQEVTIFIQPIPASPAEEEMIEEEVAGKNLGAGAFFRITASVDELNLIDSQNLVGFHPDATDGIDLLDNIEAPPFGDHVRVSILENNERYATNYKSSQQPGGNWHFILTTSNADLVRNNIDVLLNFQPQTPDAAQYAMALIDEDYGYARRVEHEKITVNWGDGLSERNFRLVVGSSQYVENQLSDTPVAPALTKVDQNYPNPFKQKTHISYQLSERDEVELVVYNLLGQKVQTLVQSAQNPGRYSVTWDGTDSAGRFVGSGVYIYRLQSGSFSTSGKMILAR